MNTSRRLTRSNTDRIVAGVAGGVANYLDIDPTLVRLGFVLLVLVGGVSPVIYLILWAVLPNENSLNQGFSQQVRENLSEIEQRATEVASKVSNQVNQFVGSDQTKQPQQPAQPSADQARQVNQSAYTYPTGQTPPNDTPSTGPTTRL